MTDRPGDTMGGWPMPSSTILGWRGSTTRSIPTAAISTSTWRWSTSSGPDPCSTSDAARARSPACSPSGASRSRPWIRRAARLDVARAKPGADAVRWMHGDATTLPGASGRCRVHDGQHRAGVPHRRRLGRHAAAAHGGRCAGWLAGVRDSRAGPSGLGAVDAGAHPHGRRHGRRRRGGVVGGGHRRGRRSRHVPVDDRRSARRRRDRIGVDVAVPRSARDRSVAGRQRIRARRGPRCSRSARVSSSSSSPCARPDTLP